MRIKIRPSSRLVVRWITKPSARSGGGLSIPVILWVRWIVERVLMSHDVWYVEKREEKRVNREREE